MKVLGTWQGGYRTVLEDSTGHRVTVDLPRDEGGENAGPFALELSVLSLAGCVTTIFALVAQKRRLKFEGMSIELDAQRPVGAPTIASVEGVLRVTTTASRDEVESTFDITLRTCPVGVLYEKAHIPVRVRLEVVSPQTPVEALLR